MKIPITLLLIFHFLISESNLLAQILLNGTVLESHNETPLPYAHIYLSGNNKIGTISNIEGNFSLSLPENSINDSIIISFIGFKTSILPVRFVNSQKNFVCRLDESQNLLSEVIIVAQDTMQSFLLAAFKRIPFNYPSESFLIEGLYRETNFLEDLNKFIYFSEAIIEYYNSPYINNTSKYGPVKIIEGGKYEIKNRHSISNIHFYAGLYSPQRFDFVKKRIEFIHPDHLSDYIYSVDGLFEYEGRPTFQISFRPKKNALYEGSLFIDKQTLAYVKCNYKLSDEGLKKENFGNLSTFDYSNRTFKVQYKLKENKWHLWFVIQDGKGYNRKFDNVLRYTNEFVAFQEKEVLKNPISDSEAVPFHAFYTSQEKKFSDSYWHKPEVISRTKKLDSTISLLFKREELTNNLLLSNDSSDLTKEKSFSIKRKLLKLSTSISNGISLTVAPLKFTLGNYQVSYRYLFSLSKEIGAYTVINSLGLDFKYYINNNTCMVLQMFANDSGNTNMALLSLGAQYSKRLLGWKRPLYLETGLNIYTATSQVKIGTLDSSIPFYADGINFKGQQELTISLGEERWGILTSLELIYKLHSHFALFTKSSVAIFSKQSNKLFIQKEKSFWSLNRKTASIDASSPDVVIKRNNQIVNQSPVTFNQLQWIFNFGLRFGLNK